MLLNMVLNKAKSQFCNFFARLSVCGGGLLSKLVLSEEILRTRDPPPTHTHTYVSEVLESPCMTGR